MPCLIQRYLRDNEMMFLFESNNEYSFWVAAW
jgi:hypothetical protein